MLHYFLHFQYINYSSVWFNSISCVSIIWINLYRRLFSNSCWHTKCYLTWKNTLLVKLDVNPISEYVRWNERMPYSNNLECYFETLVNVKQLSSYFDLFCSRDNKSAYLFRRAKNAICNNLHEFWLKYRFKYIS